MPREVGRPETGSRLPLAVGVDQYRQVAASSRVPTGLRRTSGAGLGSLPSAMVCAVRCGRRATDSKVVGRRVEHGSLFVRVKGFRTGSNSPSAPSSHTGAPTTGMTTRPGITTRPVSTRRPHAKEVRRSLLPQGSQALTEVSGFESTVHVVNRALISVLESEHRVGEDGALHHAQ